MLFEETREQLKRAKKSISTKYNTEGGKQKDKVEEQKDMRQRGRKKAYSPTEQIKFWVSLHKKPNDILKDVLIYVTLGMRKLFNLNK